MARKKKVNDVEEVPVEDTPIENTETTMEEVPITDVPETVDTPTVKVEDVPAVKVARIEKRVDILTIEECKKEAIKEIERCTAYVVSGVDKNYGRIFEMSRAEWGMYYVNVEYYAVGKRTSFPEKPKRLDIP